MLLTRSGVFVSPEDSALAPVKIEVDPANTLLSERSQASKLTRYNPICMACPEQQTRQTGNR